MTLPFIISIPHSSANVPDDIGDTLALNQHQVIESVDFGTLEIFGALPAREIVTAQWSRLIVDLNRAPDQTDAKGVVAHTDYHGRPIYQPGQYPDRETINQRVNRFHRPFHEKIERALNNSDIIGLIDSHSLNGTGPDDAPDPGRRRKDVILSNNGDLNGEPRPGSGRTSCTVDQIRRFKQAFEDQGFSVSLNSPYRGGYITNHYGPLLAKEGRFAIQIEMNQDLFMRPGSLEPEKHRLAVVAQKVLMALEKVIWDVL